MKLKPSDWKPSHNHLVPLPSGRWMPVHDRRELGALHIQDAIPAGEKDCFGKNPRPWILGELNRRATELFYKPARHIQWCFHKTQKFNQTWHANVRLMRSQAIDAIIALVAVMVLNMDLATMLIARRDGHELHHYDLKWLAAQAGLTYSAAKRAYAWLKKQGIITTGDKICEEHPDGTFSGRACAKLISPSFFAYFGLSAELKAQRDWASGRLKEQPAGQGKQDPAQREAVENMQHHAKMVELEKSNRQAAKQAEKQAATPAKPATPPTTAPTLASHHGEPKRSNAVQQIGDIFSKMGWR